jgi:hypothetical protein
MFSIDVRPNWAEVSKTLRHRWPVVTGSRFFNTTEQNMNVQSLFLMKAWSRHLILVCVTAAIGLLSACASNGKNVGGFDELHLAPGDTGTCDSSPCQVFFLIPAGTGSYQVTGNGLNLGTYPAGKEAGLGNFWENQIFQIRGMDVPDTHAYIPPDR